MRWLTFAFGLLLITIVVIANRGGSPLLFQWVYLLPGRDLTMHFLLMGTMTFLLIRTLVRSSLKEARPYLLGAASFSILVTVEELSQLFLANRSFSLADLGADYMGIISFAILAWWLEKRRDTTLERPADL